MICRFQPLIFHGPHFSTRSLVSTATDSFLPSFGFSEVLPWSHAPMHRKSFIFTRRSLVPTGGCRKSIGNPMVKKKTEKVRKGGGKWPRNCMKLLDLMLVNQIFFCPEEMEETWNVGFLMCDLDKGPVIQCTTIYRRYGGCTNWMFNLFGLPFTEVQGKF